MKLIRFPLLALLLVLMLAACGGTAAPSPPASAKPSSQASSAALRKAIFATPSSDFTGFPSAVARDQGFFRQHGLDMSVQLMQSPATMAALQAGELQFTSSTGTSVRSAAQGLPIRVIAHVQTEPFSFVTRPEVPTIAALKGKRVGFNAIGGDDYVYTLAALKSAQLTPQDVEMLSVGSTAEIDKALLSGQLAGGVMGPPFVQQVAQLGFHVHTGPDLLLLPSGGLATSVQVLQKDPQLVRDTLAAILDAIVWTRSNPDQARAYFIKQFNLPPDIIKPAYEQMMSSLRFNFSDSDLQAAIDRALSQSKTEKKVSVTDVYDLAAFDELVKAKGLR
ncbi:MAG TPA: ABC transporter substrate-binding protein [Chloroflexota bacterium]